MMHKLIKQAMCQQKIGRPIRGIKRDNEVFMEEEQISLEVKNWY